MLIHDYICVALANQYSTDENRTIYLTPAERLTVEIRANSDARLEFVYVADHKNRTSQFYSTLPEKRAARMLDALSVEQFGIAPEFHKVTTDELSTKAMEYVRMAAERYFVDRFTRGVEK